MKVKRTLITIVAVASLAVAAMALTACGGAKNYAASVEFDEVNTASDSTLDLVMVQSVTKVETLLDVDKDAYTLTKRVYTGKVPDTEKEDKVNADLWYTSYQMFAEYVFKGKCSVAGSEVTLETPSSATRLAYYTMDVSKIYPKKFPFAATIVLPDSRDWTGLAEKAVVAIESDSYEMAYFGGLYIQNGTECKKQIAKVDGEKLVSVTPDANATAVTLKPKPGDPTPTPDPTPDPGNEALVTLQREGADCKLTLEKGGKFTFDYKGMVKETGTYTYSGGKISFTVKEGASCTVTEEGGNIKIKYVAAANNQLQDTFTISSAELAEKLS